MWYHPKYYEEMKRKRKELERQAASDKQEGDKDEHQASSDKQQATEQQAE